MSDRPEIEIQRQTAFSEDGQLELTETSVETSLEDLGADIDHRDRDSRLDRPTASDFGVDDRPEIAQSSTGDQSTLFADTDTDQQTLVGDEVAMQCLFEDSPTDGLVPEFCWLILEESVVPRGALRGDGVPQEAPHGHSRQRRPS